MWTWQLLADAPDLFCSCAPQIADAKKKISLQFYSLSHVFGRKLISTWNITSFNSWIILLLCNDRTRSK